MSQLRFLESTRRTSSSDSGHLKRSFSRRLCQRQKTIAIPVQDLDHVPPPVAKGKEMPGKWIKIQLVLHQDGKPVYRLPHVRSTNRQIHPQTRKVREHQRASSVDTSLASVADENPSPTSTVNRPLRLSLKSAALHA